MARLEVEEDSTRGGGRRWFLAVLFSLLGACAAAIAAGAAKFAGYLGSAGPPRRVILGALRDVARRAPFHVRGGSAWIMKDEGGLYALLGRCPHLGCLPAWDSEKKRFICPCHGSQFDPEGGLLSGPARTGMKHLTLMLDRGGRVVLAPRQEAPAEARLPAGGKEA